MITIETAKFGTVTLNEENVIHFENGILGFEKIKRFFLIPSENSNIIFWLQAIDDPCISIPCIDPLKICGDYDPLVDEEELKQLGADGNKDDLTVLCVLLIPHNFKESTVNLAAPIVINNENMKAKQIILQRENYPVNLKIFASGGEEK